MTRFARGAKWGMRGASDDDASDVRDSRSASARLPNPRVARRSTSRRERRLLLRRNSMSLARLRPPGPILPLPPGEGRGEGARQSKAHRSPTPPHPNTLPEREGNRGGASNLLVILRYSEGSLAASRKCERFFAALRMTSSIGGRHSRPYGSGLLHVPKLRGAVEREAEFRPRLDFR